jgi:hypothetical protein
MGNLAGPSKAMWFVLRKCVLPIGCLSAVIMATVVLWTAHTANASQKIQTIVTGVPRDAIFICLASEANGKSYLMDHVITSELLTDSPMDPRDCITSLVDELGVYRLSGSPWHSRLYWKDGQRIGVVIGRRNRSWEITWWKSDEVVFQPGNGWFGNKKALFDLGTKEAVLMAKETLRDLALGPVEKYQQLQKP